jgi:hypothetical protein
MHGSLRWFPLDQRLPLGASSDEEVDDATVGPKWSFTVFTSSCGMPLTGAREGHDQNAPPVNKNDVATIWHFLPSLDCL